MNDHTQRAGATEEPLAEPKTPLDRACRALADIALSVTHHDIDPSEPEAIHEIRIMERKFKAYLTGWLRSYRK